MLDWLRSIFAAILSFVLGLFGFCKGESCLANISTGVSSDSSNAEESNSDKHVSFVDEKNENTAIVSSNE
jgi:hypothetical protein